MRVALFLLILMVSVSGVDAQQNPFRLKHKQGKAKEKENSSDLNPFRLTWKKVNPEVINDEPTKHNANPSNSFRV